MSFKVNFGSGITSTSDAILWVRLLVSRCHNLVYCRAKVKLSQVRRGFILCVLPLAPECADSAMHIFEEMLDPRKDLHYMWHWTVLF
jgi:hypothetical protein